MKMKKYLSVFIILILLFSIFSIGYSIWIISDKVLIKPSNVTSDVVQKYLDLSCNNAYTYNGSIQLPTSEVLDTSELTFYYKESGSSDYIKCTETIGPKNAGTYEIKVEYKKNTGVDTFETITINPTNNFVISPKSLEVLWSNTTINYDGSPHLPTATITSGLISGDSCNVSVSVDGYASGPTDIGTYSAIATTDNSNYIVSNSPNTFVIKSLVQELSIEVADGQTSVYNGTAQGPSGIKVYLSTKDSEGNELSKEEVNDATLTYSYNNLSSTEIDGLPTDALDYKVTIQASKIGYDPVSTWVYFKINKRNIDLSWSYTTVTYDGNAHSPIASVQYTDDVSSPGILNIDKDKVAISVTGAINAGVNTSVASLTGDKATNYSISNSTYLFAIRKANMTLTENPSITNTNYIEGDDINVSGGKLTGVKGETLSCTSSVDTSKVVFVDSTDKDSMVSSGTVKITFKSSNTNYNDYVYYGSIEIFAVATISNMYFGTVARAITSANYGTYGKEVYLIPGRNPKLSESITINSGVTLYLVYNVGSFVNNRKGTAGTFADANPNAYLKNTLTITTNTVLTNKGTINIDGVVGNSSAGISGQTSGNYTQIVLQNNSKINSYGNIYCLGYIKESSSNNGSQINMFGSILSAPFVIYDFQGGSISQDLDSKGICPFNIYDMPNIHPQIIINSGARYEGLADLYIGTNDTHYNQKIYIIGAQSDSQALFKINSGTITIKYNTSNTTGVTNENGFMNIMINGTAETGNVTLTMKILIFTVNISTSKYYCPIPWKLQINIKSGTTTLSTKLKFMPGTKLVVDQGASLNINQNCVFYDIYNQTAGGKKYPTTMDAAYLEVNGICNANQSIGGRIITNADGSQLYIGTASISITDNSSESGNTVYAKGNISGIDNQNFSNSTNYLSNGTYWVAQTPSGSYTVNYHYYDASGNSQTQSTSYNIFDGVTPVIPTISIPNRSFYEFTNWFTSETGGSLYDTITVESGQTYDIYAQYNAKEYTISYVDVNGTYTFDDTILTIENLSTSSILNPTNSSDTFVGWYTTSEWTSSDTKIPAGTSNYDSLLALITKLEENGLNAMVLYGKYIVSYEVTFEGLPPAIIIDDDNVLLVEQGTTISNLDELSLSLTNMKDDKSCQYYFEGWYTDIGYTEEFTAATIINSNMSVYAKIGTKYSITYYNGDGVVDEVDYYMSNTSFNLKLKTDQTSGPDVNGEKIIYTFNKWTIDGVDYDGNSLITINKDLVATPSFSAAYHYKVSIGTTSNATITFTANGNPGSFDNYYENGTELVFTITYDGDSDKSFTINGVKQNDVTSCEHTIEGTQVIVSASSTSSGSGCLAEGTLITMADGTKKKVEEIVAGDLLIVFDHETGQYTISEVLFNDFEEISNYTVINLEFSNGSIVKVISEHGFFDLDEMKYVYIDEFNYQQYVGHRFVSVTIENGIPVQSVVTLNKSYLTEEYIRVYSPVTKYHLNYITEDLLSMPGGITGLFNIFEYDDDLKFNEEKMQQDIETFGLFTYDDFKDYVSYEMYESFPTQYLKIAIAKGLCTWEDIEYYINRYAPLM